MASRVDSVAGREVQSLSEDELFTLSRNLRGNTDKFEKALKKILLKLVPNMTEEAWSRVVRNIDEHQEECASQVAQNYFVYKGVQNFLEPLFQMVKRFSR